MAVTKIHITTVIHAPVQICFDLSRSVRLHVASTAHTDETVAAGRQTGLFEEGDIVTWRARHFGVYQKLTMQVYNVYPPHSFEDKMIRGIFKSLHHCHQFSFQNETTFMIDQFEYETPGGIVGVVFDRLVLRAYMTALLKKRNHFIKHIAESGKWHNLL